MGLNEFLDLWGRAQLVLSAAGINSPGWQAVTALLATALVWAGLNSTISVTIHKFLKGYPWVVANSEKISGGVALVLLVSYCYAAIIFCRPLISVTFENREPWEHLDRIGTDDHSISITLIPTRKLRGTKVYIHSISTKNLGDRNNTTLNGNIDLQIGWLGGAKSFEPVDIEQGGMPWPIVVIQKKTKRTFMLCNEAVFAECKNFKSIEPGVYELSIRIKAENEPDFDKKIEMSVFQDPKLFRMRLVE